MQTESQRAFVGAADQHARRTLADAEQAVRDALSRLARDDAVGARKALLCRMAEEVTDGY